MKNFKDLIKEIKTNENKGLVKKQKGLSFDFDQPFDKKKLEEESEPPPFLERPGTQRWFGRLETLVTVGVVAVGLSAAYSYGSGGLK